MSYYNAKGSRFQKSKKDQHEKANNSAFNEKNWIGVDNIATQNNNFTYTQRNKTDWIQKKDEVRTQPRQQADTRITIGNQSNITKGLTIGNKSTVQLMQDILKGVREGQEIRSYYSKQAEQTLSELLTNKYKLTNYIKKMQTQMVSLDSSVVKNYQILVILLQQLGSSDVQIRHSSQGMDIRFNRGIIQRQQAEIQRLQKQKQQREKQIKYIIDEYESIIFNFNDVIQKLVSKEDIRKNKY